MIVHYNWRIDWGYLAYTVIWIFAISLVPAILTNPKAVKIAEHANSAVRKKHAPHAPDDWRHYVLINAFLYVHYRTNGLILGLDRNVTMLFYKGN